LVSWTDQVGALVSGQQPVANLSYHLTRTRSVMIGD